MVFDRNAMMTGRRMQDFGLCDLQGVYQNTAKLRSKGYLVLAFLSPADAGSLSLARLLDEWTSISDKLTVVAVVVGEREQVERLASGAAVTYPVWWDFEMYTLPQWAVTATPTLFIMNGDGVVLGRVLGNNTPELSAAKSMLEETIRKADDAAKAKADAEAKAKEEADAAGKAAAPDPKQAKLPLQ